MTMSTKTIMIVSVVVVVCLGALVVEAQTHALRRVFDNFAYDNQNHYLPCDQLPTAAEVNRVVREHQNVIEAIEKVNSGLVGVEVDSTTCPGRADLLIWYASHENRLEIEKIIAGDSFYGVPYRLNNR